MFLDESDGETVKHEGIVCDSCNDQIIGFRYKCVSCDNYDLCPKCEALETHPHHYMLRIPRPIKFVSKLSIIIIDCLHR